MCTKSRVWESWSGGEYGLTFHTLFVSNRPHTLKHILAHSLGSALSAHILSAQPTIQRPLSEFSQEELSGMSRQFLFNTRHVLNLVWERIALAYDELDSHLFTLGSPLGVFMHINQAQLIARKVLKIPKYFYRDWYTLLGTGTNNARLARWSGMCSHLTRKYTISEAHDL